MMYLILSHDISKIRNIYNWKEFGKKDIIIKDGICIEGHHRFIASFSVSCEGRIK